MAVLICIKRVQLVNIANRFICIFSNLETSIRFIFPGGAGYPYLPTRLITLQLILEQYMVELHSPPGRYTVILYLADYVNTLNLL